MKDCFSILQIITRSTEELLADRLNSLESTEIKHSAGVFRSSIQPCLEEIERSALQLRTYLDACIENLDAAEDLWHSKQRIAEIPTVQILEAIGKATGIWNCLQQEVERLEQDLIEQAYQVWNDDIEAIEQQTFWDKKREQYREAIGWGDKELFRRLLPERLKYVSTKIDELTDQTLVRLHEKADQNYFELGAIFEALDESTRLDHTEKYCGWAAVMQKRLKQALESTFCPSLIQIFHGTVEEWQKRFGDISYKEVQNFKQKVSEKIEERIVKKIDDRVEVIQELVEHTIEFYHNLLTKQNRYRQETPQQQKAEQAWITQQREHLQRLLADLEQVSRAC